MYVFIILIFNSKQELFNIFIYIYIYIYIYTFNIYYIYIYKPSLLSDYIKNE